jgi:twitching motility protein PilU
MGFNDLLKMLIENEGSDLFLTTGAPPSMKAFGRLSPLVDKKMPEGMVKKIAYQIMNEDQIKDFEKSPEMNLAIADPDIGRFRVNIFKQRGEVAIVARNIKTEIPSAASLGLPPILNDLIMKKNGIILLVGGTGSGKSTSLAALIDHRNKNSDGHIITIEDPVEFIHPHQKSIVNQREIGVDTNSYEEVASEYFTTSARRNSYRRDSEPGNDGTCSRIRGNRPSMLINTAREQCESGLGPHY